MASSLLALLDDIATMTKVAAGKTAGVLGDDLDLNAQQVSGVRPERELPVVWKVAKGSLVNKAILVPAALLISIVAPWAIIPLLMIGGLFLCYEGFEKVFHKLLVRSSVDQEHEKQEKTKLVEAILDPSRDLVAVERDKIKGAIRTDFILSAEIVVISLGTMPDAAWPMRLAVLCTIAILMTVGVYGLVAGIVKLDDAGVNLSRRGRPWSQLGRGILVAAPWLMRALTVVGTAAMFLVGGGILSHGVPAIEHWFHAAAESTGWMEGATAALLNGVLGVIAGGLVVALSVPVRALLGRTKGHA